MGDKMPVPDYHPKRPDTRVPFSELEYYHKRLAAAEKQGDVEAVKRLKDVIASMKKPARAT
jgi:hypothetical protein